MKELILFIKGTRSRKSPDLSYVPNITANVQDVDTHDVSSDWARIQLFSPSIPAVVTAVLCRCTKAPPPWTGEVTQYDVHMEFINQALSTQSNRYPQHPDRCRQHLKYCYFPCKYCRITSYCKDYCLFSEKLAYPLFWFYEIQILKKAFFFFV